MSRRFLYVTVGGLALATMACSLLSQVAGSVVNKVAGSGFTSVNSLWPDVPKMDGLTNDPNLDMPIYAKIYVQTALKAASGGTGGVDWVAFTTDQTAADISNYYTVARMSAQGWDADQSTPCFSGSEQGVSEAGTICLFTKSSSSPQVLLAILAATDTSSNKTDVFFLRVSEQVTPTP